MSGICGYFGPKDDSGKIIEAMASALDRADGAHFVNLACGAIAAGKPGALASMESVQTAIYGSPEFRDARLKTLAETEGAARALENVVDRARLRRAVPRRRHEGLGIGDEAWVGAGHRPLGKAARRMLDQGIPEVAAGRLAPRAHEVPELHLGNGSERGFECVRVLGGHRG